MNKAQVLSKFFVFLMKSADDFYSTPEGQEIYKSIRRQDMIDSIVSVLQPLAVILVCVIFWLFIRWFVRWCSSDFSNQKNSIPVELKTQSDIIEQRSTNVEKENPILNEFSIPLYPLDEE